MESAPADYRRANNDSRARLHALISRLGPDQLTTNVMDAWSVSALLAHLAFWDRFVLKRWRTRLAGGAIPDIAPLFDILNDAALPAWSALAPEVAARQAIEAGDEVDMFVAALAPEAIAQILAEGRQGWIFRSKHRQEHLEQIERALGR
jgi:DinB superfamily